MAAGEERTDCVAAASAGEGAHPAVDLEGVVPDGPDHDVQVPVGLIRDESVPGVRIPDGWDAAALTMEAEAAVVLVGRLPAACRPAAAFLPAAFLPAARVPGRGEQVMAGAGL